MRVYVSASFKRFYVSCLTGLGVGVLENHFTVSVVFAVMTQMKASLLWVSLVPDIPLLYTVIQLGDCSDKVVP